MRVLVTGGAGFIGSHTVEALVQGSHRVLVVDDLSTSRTANLDGVRGLIDFEQIDIRDRAGLDSTFRAWAPDAVLHLAAIVSVPASVAAPIETASVNLIGSLNVLDLARVHGVRRVLATSSAAVYGAGEGRPNSETDAPCPASPYAVDKLAMEHHLRVCGELYGIQTLALRYFNVYGPRQLGAGTDSGVVALLMEALRGRSDFQVFGDGRQVRDYISVWDAATINRRLLEAAEWPVRVLNVGTGQPTSLLELVDTAAAVFGSEPALRFHPARPGDVLYSCADVAGLRALLGDLDLLPLAGGLQRLHSETGTDAQ